MLDEFESLAGNIAFNASFYGELRSLAGELGVVYITASKRSLYDLTYQHADTLSSPFFNIFSEQPLGLLPQEEAVLMLAQISAMGGQSPFSQEQIETIINLAGAHPFFLQVAGHYLYTEREGNLAGHEVLLANVERRFKAEAEDHYRYLWSQLSDEEQAALLHLSTASNDKLKRLQAKALLCRPKKKTAVCNLSAALLPNF